MAECAHAATLALWLHVFFEGLRVHHTWDLAGKSAAWTVPTTVVRPFRPLTAAPRRRPALALAQQPEPARCRGCGAELQTIILDLGSQPAVERRAAAEPARPLRIAHCGACHLTQLAGDRLEMRAQPAPNRSHARQDIDSLVKGLRLTAESLVVELASGTGAMLHQFQERGIRVLGMEPDHDNTRTATDRGIPTRACGLDDFTAKRLVKDGLSADLLITHDAIARAPQLDRFLIAARRVLKTNGILLIETPHLLRIVQETRFDAFRHEHGTYFSLGALERVLAAHGLRVVHATPARTAGLLRAYACRTESTLVQSESVGKMLARENEAALDRDETMIEFGDRARVVMQRLRVFIQDIVKEGKTIVAYGASADGDTLLGYCGARAGMIAYIADPDPARHGTVLPGTGIPVVAPDRIRASRPDFLLVLPGWPVQDVVRQHSYIQSWGGRFGCLALR
jgi:SAM-dependent methyltransferase